MIYFENNSTNPYFNLALEEYFLKYDAEDDILILWRNDNTVVVGRYQNTAQEINERFCRENRVSVVRRNTGGGAVYHDLGNLNFSIITGYKQGDDISFRRFLGAISVALKKLGVDARLRGRNDLVVGDKKVSGSAQTIVAGRILHHGTLLCNSDLDMLAGALQSDPKVYASKAIASVRSRVANIQDFNTDVTVDMLKGGLLSEFRRSAPLLEYKLQEVELAEVCLLQKSKYDTWRWNYGESPAFNFSKTTRFTLGSVTVSLIVEAGIIHRCAITGDFLGLMDVADVEDALTGTRLLFGDVAARIARFDAGLYFGGITSEEVAGCFF